ncbi:hypothetical protein CASFOL_040825 [Castilleja foliolosa]|uniref:Pre-mRNA-processing factor 39 n=1 Tax=Castilleja foliolosa TaxID=1961234 RepID=A0ABD3BD29_9LAMI
MAAQSSNPANTTANLSQRLDKMISGGSLDYNSWISLISEIETHSPEDIDTISSAYDSFLSKFPLCHWHLDKYANHMVKMRGPEEAVNIYERGVGMAMYSVGFWVDYFSFAAASFGNPEDVRRLFKRAFLFVDKDYFCHALWDKYMKYEFELEGWSFLAHSYIQALRFPTKKLQFYYVNFKQFITNLEEEMRHENNNCNGELIPVPCASTEISADEISLVIKDLLDSPDESVKSKALNLYKSIGENYYHEACQVDKKIKCFEQKIQRRYFFASPIDDDELSNWHFYLDFVEKQGNMNWVMKLYERCLIPCAHYPELWMRYVEFLESKGGRELAISALDRATRIFLKNVPEIHLFNARFKEHIGDVSGARAALTLSDTKTDSSFVENVVMLANLERRHGNIAAASDAFVKALKNAKEKQKTHVLPNLYFHFAQLTFLTSGNTAAARDVLIDGLRDVRHCRFLLQELIKFAMTHEGASQVNIIDPIIDDAISTGLDEYEGLTAKDRENLSHLFLEFVDLCGTIHDMRRAWNRHIKLFPQSLRIKPTTPKHTTSYSRDSEMDQKGQEMVVFKSPENHETRLDQAPEKPSSQTQKDELGSKENVLSARDQENSKQMDIIPVLATQLTRENTLTPHESTERDGVVQEVKDTDEAGPTRMNSNQITQSSGQQQWEGQSMSQMLYNYHQQQQMLQQQYQQQYQMQYNYFNQQQQPYQMQPRQQHYGLQQNDQQSQDVAYQAQLLAYQQQLQQYQQYQQGYQHYQQRQSMEGPSLMQEQHNSSLDQQDSKKGPPEYKATVESSESPHLIADQS